MTDTNKKLYKQWTATQEHLPIFMQPWWMDAVCAGKEWDVLLSYNPDGTIRAALPYLIRKKWHMRWIVMPQETQIGGIWLAQNGGLIEGTEDAIDIRAICDDFVEQLKALKLSYYYQHYPIASKAVPVMKALGFRTRERVTYRIEDLHDLDAVIAAFSKNKKRQLQKALSLHAERGMSAEEFHQTHRYFLGLQHKQITYTREFLLVLDRKTRRNNQAEVITIRNADGVVYAAAYLVWDKHNMYYLMPCFNPMHKDSGASALLVLEALKLAREKGVIFDFEGSMVRGIANHYRQFGSKPATYYSVERYYNPLFAIALFINKLRNIKYGI